MDSGAALDRVQSGLGEHLRAFVTVYDDDIEVTFARSDVAEALEGHTLADPHESRLREVARTMLAPDETAAVRYTADEIVVGLPAPGEGHTGYLVSLDHTASPAVEDFIDVLLESGATLREPQDGLPGVSRNGESHDY